MERFDGRATLVVGGASGIGGAVARRLADEGARVAVADLDLQGATRVAAAIDGLMFGVDFTDEPSATVFKTVAFVRSAILPGGVCGAAIPWVYLLMG
jgi:NAD(P)-dependent dehydrogenase (short-subunit alcohol dehydrogenase family)